MLAQTLLTDRARSRHVCRFICLLLFLDRKGRLRVCRVVHGRRDCVGAGTGLASRPGMRRLRG
jgi:hypothetical protein